MSARILSAAMVLAAGLIHVQPALAQPEPKKVVATYAFDLACRRVGEPEITKQTRKLGVEAYHDGNNSLGIYLSQVGALAVGRGSKESRPSTTVKNPEWVTGLDLPARAAGEDKFENAKIHSLEVFRDPQTNNCIYITEKGYLAVAPVGGKNVAAADKRPKWMHSADLSVRKGGVSDWKDARKIGIEVYRDNSTGNLIYISETGSIAAIADNGKTAAESKAPTWLHGLDLQCRKHDEPAFSKDTRKLGIEVFFDTNNGNLIYIVENGNLAVAAGPATVSAPTPKVKQPVWTHGLNLKARKAGEKEFTERTAVFGAEVFRDENVGVTLYVSEIGAIAALRK